MEKRLLWRACLFVAMVLPATQFAAGYPSTDPVPPVIQQNYDTAHRDVAAHPDDVQADCRLGLACFDIADFARNSAERAKIANEGIAACRQAVARAPQLARAHYYLGLNLAQLARTKSWGALKIVGEMEQELNVASRDDPMLDYAGPERFLGLLLRDAPGWPISIGNRPAAERDLRRAVALAPGYPDNLLDLAESELMWDEPFAAAADLARLQKILPEARKQFSGPYRVSDWKDWDHRIDALQGKLHQQPEHSTRRRP